jgi:hypothetical protein
MTRLSALAMRASALPSSTRALRQRASVASARAIRLLTYKPCWLHMSSRANKYPTMATTVGSSSRAPKFSKVRTLASQTGRLRSRGGKYFMAVGPKCHSYIWHRYFRALRATSWYVSLRQKHVAVTHQGLISMNLSLALIYTVTLQHFVPCSTYSRPTYSG